MNGFEGVAVVLVVLVAVAVAAVMAGAVILPWKAAWAVWLRVEKYRQAKAKRLIKVMENAASMNLPEAIRVLADAGMYYDSKAKWRGQSLKLPKCFWRSTEWQFNAPLKALTIVTIVTSAVNNTIGDDAGRIVAQQVLESLAQQARKTPTRVMAVVGMLSDKIAGNVKLSAFPKELADMGTYQS